MVRLAERVFGSDYRSMNKIALSLAAIAVLTCGSVYGRLPDDMVGTWRAIVTLKTQQGTETSSPEMVISKLRSGDFYLVSKEKKNGKSALMSKHWLKPNGRYLNEVYAGRGRIVQTAKGTWRLVSSNIMRGNLKAKSRYGDITGSFTMTLSNKNRWVRTDKIKQGNVTATSRVVAVRIR